MKKIKSLTCLIAIAFLSACSSGHSSATFSSSLNNNSSSQTDTSDYYDGYYSSLVSWRNGEDLKNQLHTIIHGNGYTPISYIKSSKQNYDSNINADHSKYDFENLDVIYSDKTKFRTETNKGWQREHAWCASLMCGKLTGDAVATLGRATDFHNLFAADAGGNQSRGNKNYGDANKDSEYYTDRTAENGYDGYSYDETTFEPANKDKGRLARAIFYMATMYKDSDDSGAGLRILEDNVVYPFETGREYAIGNLYSLLRWNNDYAVDYLEMQHNISVYTNTNNPDGVAQGNRNPYVDYPGLVDYVYGSKKDQPGTLDDVVASASYLDCKGDDISHYAIKEAKREHGYNEQFASNEYKVVSVKKNYAIGDASTGIVHSLEGHTFSESDGDTVNATITTPVNTLSYQINLNPMGLCSSGILTLGTDGINKTQSGVDQDVSFGDEPFVFKYVTSYSGTMTINNIGTGGITVGSANRVLTNLTITTKNTYTVDKLFIKAQAGNATSMYTLSIKVGEQLIRTNYVNDSTAWKVFGGELNEPLSGQISFIFTGTSSLKINSIAFNSISV